jgi:creatinine amidohydrolase
MKLKGLLILFGLSICAVAAAQNLPVQLENLTAVQFKEAVKKSCKTVIIPIGVIEKHGAHMPLGTDVYYAREIALRAAEKEYVVVFPWYYFAQINEARHQPGTIAYSPELLWKMLQETLDELHRNGFEKIILYNGHGGNKSFLDYFVYCQLAEKRDYALYWYKPKKTFDPEVVKQVKTLTIDKVNQHGGHRETSILKHIVPHLVDTSIANTQSGADLNRLGDLKNVYTSIWWYARFPNHYAGDGSQATAEAGALLVESAASRFAETIKAVKADKKTLKLMKQFYEESENPLNTKQPY